MIASTLTAWAPLRYVQPNSAGQLRNLVGPLCPMRFLIRQRYVDTQQHDRSLITPNHQIPTRGREVSQLSQHQHVNKFAHAPKRLLCSSSKLGICLCFITFGRTFLGEEVSPGWCFLQSVKARQNITGPGWISKLEVQTPSISDVYNGTLHCMN